ncbi:hypothetical protein FS837_011069 [Tulasnella sp. UAMH 9824]|nr:hypothetical protein FS837_011069 [Tulasnella sp. UAMH 9824]
MASAPLNTLPSKTTSTDAKVPSETEPRSAKAWPGGIPNARTVMDNTAAMANAPVFIMQTFTVFVNKLPVTERLYERMNVKYSAENIHIFGTFFITTAVYWALGLVFIFYAKIHKKHHEYTAPVALASTYCTMAEHALSNLMPVILGLVILGSHWSLIVMYFCDLEIGTLCTHSGYNIPYCHRSLTHDYHHYSFNENFGPLGILDALYGTSKSFKKIMKEAQDRHDGDYNKASEEVMSRLAQWEVEKEERERKAIFGEK